MKLKMNLTVALLKKTNVKILSKFWGVVDGSQGGDSSTAKKTPAQKLYRLGGRDFPKRDGVGNFQGAEGAEKIFETRTD